MRRVSAGGPAMTVPGGRWRSLDKRWSTVVSGGGVLEVLGLTRIAVPGNDRPSLGPDGTRNVVPMDNQSGAREFLASGGRR